eukprot:6158135-Amphidinium_carterae.1
MLKHYTQWLHTIQEYETTHNTKISDDIKIASAVNSVRGQLRNHLLLNMNETTSFDDIKKAIAGFFQSMYVIQQTNSGGKKGKGKNQNQIQQWNQNQQTSYQPGKYHTQYQQPQAKARIRKDPVHNTKAKERASHQSLVGHVAGQVTRQSNAGGKDMSANHTAEWWSNLRPVEKAQSSQRSLAPLWTYTTESRRTIVARSSVKVMFRDVVRSGYSCMTQVLQYQ